MRLPQAAGLQGNRLMKVLQHPSASVKTGLRLAQQCMPLPSTSLSLPMHQREGAADEIRALVQKMTASAVKLVQCVRP